MDPTTLWNQTASGCPWHLLTPSPEAVDWRDVAAALAKICRFNGHTRTFYSVAQHAVHVADLLPLEARLYGLLHDAHEAYIGGMTTPLKQALAYLGTRQPLEHLTAVTDRAIYAAAGLAWPPPPTIARLVKSADLCALATEKRDLLLGNTPPWPGLPEPDRKVIRPLPWPAAMEEWFTRLEELLPTAGAL